MKLIAPALAGLALMYGGAAVGAGLPTDGSWTPFDSSTSSLLVDLPGLAEVRIVDAGTPGDRYLLTVLRGVAGVTFRQVPTSEVDPDPLLDIGTDYDAAYLNTAFSAASFELGAGQWELQLGRLTVNPGEGFGAISVLLAPIPEPGTSAMLLAGLLATGLLARRRRSMAV